VDTEYLFDDFLASVEKYKAAQLQS
jgi:hypothetical protein